MHFALFNILIFLLYSQIATATTRQDKVVGVHFFAPAYIMKLVENIYGTKSSAQTVATVMKLGKTIRKVWGGNDKKWPRYIVLQTYLNGMLWYYMYSVLKYTLSLTHVKIHITLYMCLYSVIRIVLSLNQCTETWTQWTLSFITEIYYTPQIMKIREGYAGASRRLVRWAVGLLVKCCVPYDV